MTKVLCLWAGVLFASTVAFAQGGGPLGGSVRSVVIDPTQVHALIKSGTLPVDVGQALIDAAEAQRSQIGC